MKDKIKSLIRSFPVICGASAAALLFTVLTFILGPLWLAIVELIADIAVVVYLILNYDLMSIRKLMMHWQTGGEMHFLQIIQKFWHGLFRIRDFL